MPSTPGKATEPRASRAPLVRSLLAVVLLITEANMLPTILGNVILLFLSFLIALWTLIGSIREWPRGPSSWSFVGTLISAGVILYIVFVRLLSGDVPFGYGP